MQVAMRRIREILSCPTAMFQVTIVMFILVYFGSYQSLALNLRAVTISNCLLKPRLVLRWRE